MKFTPKEFCEWCCDLWLEDYVEAYEAKGYMSLEEVCDWWRGRANNLSPQIEVGSMNTKGNLKKYQLIIWHSPKDGYEILDGFEAEKRRNK